MAIKYDFYEVNELNKTQGKLRARAVSSGTISTDKLAKWIQQRSGISAAEAKGFILMLTDCVLDFLVDGYHVEVGDLGYFSVSLTSRLVDKRNEIRAESIEFSRLNFKPTARVRNVLVHAEKQLISPKQRQPGKKYKSREERAEILRKRLEKQPCISRAEYARVLFVKKDTAINDLNTFIEEGWLCKYGTGKTVVYLLTK